MTAERKMIEQIKDRLARIQKMNDNILNSLVENVEPSEVIITCHV